MTRRKARPIIKVAIIALIAVAVLAYMVSTCGWFDDGPSPVSWFDGGPTPIPDPDVEDGRLVRLTHNDSTDRNPAWSPRGDKIAFECISDGPRGIWPFSSAPSPDGSREVRNWPITSYFYPSNICVMNADGSGRVQLTDDGSEDFDPAWSPDGSEIAFSSWRDGRSDIYVMNADGSGVRRITNDGFTVRSPTWSPDGSRIAYASSERASSDRSGSSAIFIRNADGSNPTQITNRIHYDYAPAWAPDGERIAFVSAGDNGSDICVINSDGTGRALLYATAEYDRSPAWSPDGRIIAFTADTRDNNGFADEEIVIVIDGSHFTRLTYRAGDDSNPSWSPIGRKLAFASSLAGNSEIYVMVSLNARNQRPASNDYRGIRKPWWVSDGECDPTRDTD